MEAENEIVNDDDEALMGEESDDDESMEENDDDDSSSDYSSDDDDIEYDNLLHTALMAAPAHVAARPPVDTRTPLERWREYLTKIRTRQTKVLKFIDPQLQEGGEFEVLSTFENVEHNNNNGQEVEAPEQTWKRDLLEAITTAAINPADGTTAGNLTHAILGAKMLHLLGADWQKGILVAIASHPTLSFLQLKGHTTDNQKTVLHMSAVIEAFGLYETPALCEMELLGVKFPSLQSIQQWANILGRKRGSLRQVNLVGIDNLPKLDTCENTTLKQLPVGWLDPILLALAVPTAETTSPLDELKLVMQQPQLQMPAITPQALRTILENKKKWWRLSLDGLGLQDEHLHVLTAMFQRDDTCKAGDLLSLEHNPAISSKAYAEFFEGCFFWKRRMGLIKVDDKDWEGQFDLVRSMNNLHNRLDYVVSTRQSSVTKKAPTAPSRNSIGRSPKCSFASRDKWVEWLTKLGTGLAWEDDKHRINYLWFTLMEKPEFIYSHE